MLIPKQPNPRRRHSTGRGNPISSILPRHGARIRNKSTEKKKGKTTKTKPRADIKLAKNKYRTGRTI